MGRESDMTIRTMGRLMDQLRSELVPLMRGRQNFKIVINMSAGHKWKIEVVKYVNGQ